MKDLFRGFVTKPKAPAKTGRPASAVVLPKPNRNQVIIKGL
ncbi:MAG TPA: hypothetical protein VJM32_00550 [Candidatus Saccharimonadales bacterium]|jgi:hypothetical protein|nr:hypothetical protein [Candidatus Saccharimonadales bacterium]